MNQRRTKSLSVEDRILWHRVARTVAPLAGQEHPPAYGIDESLRGETKTERKPADPPGKTARKHPDPVNHHVRPRPIDKPVRNKIAAGRIGVDATIDLHGMNQFEAHTALREFLHRAYTMHLRHVLVITGKGSSHGSSGVLRRAVPDWLATPPFIAFVSGYSDAARRHGGGGAFYVRLRRADRGRKP